MWEPTCFALEEPGKEAQCMALGVQALWDFQVGKKMVGETPWCVWQSVLRQQKHLQRKACGSLELASVQIFSAMEEVFLKQIC